MKANKGVGQMIQIVVYDTVFFWDTVTFELFWGDKFVGEASTLSEAKRLASDQCEIELWG